MAKHAIFCMMLSIGCSAQVSDTLIVYPGDPSVSGKRFSQYNNVWVMTDEGQNGISTETGMWYDTVSIDRKTSSLVRKQTVRYRNGIIRQHYDQADVKTMKPIRVRISQKNTDGSVHLVTDIAYTGNSFSGVRRLNVEGAGDGQPPLTARVNIELPEPVFDWHLWGILVASFPLSPNYAASFKAHTSAGTTNSPILWVTLKVVGSEVVTSTRWGNTDCWKVMVKAEVPWTFWIAKATDVAPIQMIKIDQTALGGSVSWWKSPN